MRERQSDYYGTIFLEVSFLCISVEFVYLCSICILMDPTSRWIDRLLSSKIAERARPHNVIQFPEVWYRDFLYLCCFGSIFLNELPFDEYLSIILSKCHLHLWHCFQIINCCSILAQYTRKWDISKASKFHMFYIFPWETRTAFAKTWTTMFGREGLIFLIQIYLCKNIGYLRWKCRIRRSFARLGGLFGKL